MFHGYVSHNQRVDVLLGEVYQTCGWPDSKMFDATSMMIVPSNPFPLVLNTTK